MTEPPDQRKGMTSVRSRNWLAGLLLALALTGCGLGESGEQAAVRRCAEIQDLYAGLYETAQWVQPEDQWEEPVLSQASRDAMEDCLMAAGLDVVDSSEVCPDYLTTGETFRSFWEQAQAGNAGEQEVIYLKENGDLYYQRFFPQDGGIWVESLYAPIEEAEMSSYECREILDWELTERGYFYYRIYPADDPHYADFSLLRLTAPDPELWELNQRYIQAGSYIATNVFLIDWWEDDFGELSFNDLWEHLYYVRYGTQFPTEGYEYDAPMHCYWIPASEFEQVMLPFFAIDRDTLRELTQYDPATGTYPWRPMEGDDHTFLHFYTIAPEVTACRDNGDGTLTLTVELYSTDLKTDCLFAHELTVRPLGETDFQFVGNRMTFQTEEYGLPYCEPRLTWGEMR